MRTIAVVNQKGGCGKTTVSINLASALAEAGQRTDPQSHCAVGLAVPEEQIEQSIYDVLISKSRNEPMRLAEILWQIGDKLELAPASIDLSAFEQQMTGITEGECCLKTVLSEVNDEYDYAIIDCPPAVGLLTFNALSAANDVIVPVETGYFSLHGLSKQLQTLDILCERSGRKINVRVLANMYDIRTKMAREILAELRSHFADKMFTTTVNFNTKIREAASFGQPISEYDPASKGQADFRALAEEVIRSETKQQRHEIVSSLTSQLEAITTTADELLAAAKPAIKTVQTPKAEKTNKMADSGQGAVEDPIPLSDGVSDLQGVDSKELNAKRYTLNADKDTDTRLSDYYGVSQINDAVVFVTLYPRAGSVAIAGDFNNWQPEKTTMERVGKSGVWQTKLKLPAGKYRYRLVVDGQWQQDPYNEQTELNPFGGFNSVLEIK